VYADTRNNTGYFSLFFSERAFERIVINDPLTPFVPTYVSNSNSYYKKLQINGIAGKTYLISLSSSYINSTTLTTNKGTIIHSTNGSGSYSFTFPSDGLPCFLTVNELSSYYFNVSCMEIKNGQDDAKTLYPSQTSTYTDSLNVHSNDLYASRWYKFYGTPVIQYVICGSTIFNYYSLSVLNPDLSNCSLIGQTFTMPNNGYVYVVFSALSSSYYNNVAFNIYNESSVHYNAIPLAFNNSTNIALTFQEYLNYDEFTGKSISSYVKWYSFNVTAGKTYTFKTYYSFSSMDFYRGNSKIVGYSYNSSTQYYTITYYAYYTEKLYLRMQNSYYNSISGTLTEQ
jgi:hypothetical protein